MNKYAPYILYLVIALLVLVLGANDFGPLRNLQRSANDFLCGFTADSSPRPGVVWVEIDGQALDEYGPWPWDYDRLADLMAAVASGDPGAIVIDFDLYESAAQDSAGHTAVLAEQLAWIKQAVLPYDIALANFRSSKTRNPGYLFNNSVTIDNPLGIMAENASLKARKIFLPAEKLLSQKPLLGFDYSQPDDDRVLRNQPLLMNYEGYYYPSISLLAAATYLGVPPGQLKVFEGHSIQVGPSHIVPIDETSAMFLKFSEGRPFVRYNAAHVLGDNFDFGLLKNKVVLIVPPDLGDQEVFATAISSSASETMVKATVIENIINQNILVVRSDLAKAGLLVLLILGGLCAFVLPRVNLLYRMVILGGSLILLANVQYLLISSYGMIVPTVYIALELVLFMLASPLLDTQLLTAGKPAAANISAKPKASAAELKRAEAEAPVREIKALPSDEENQKTTALGAAGSAEASAARIDHQTLALDDAEPALEKTSAATVDAAVASDKPKTEGGVKEPVIGQSPETPAGLSDSAAAMLVPTDLKHLGRYQISGVLGKGAMGTVYRGTDPAIDRPVALKTIRLDFVSDPEELAELKIRLHREGQAAGKMSHPNIVTIYDVGSEGSLQYIAMEYLEGQPLEDLIKKKTRFNYRIIAQIISQICSALDYAHARGIVHRDIKPANIMVLGNYQIKVMDFGIARVDSNSMTKTGIAMGTPNYISPEQLKGQEIDRRADLFSLGVVMYEMLLGRLPFKGENLTSLMYSILNQEPEKPSNIRPQIPLLFDHIVGRALQKDPDKRYQKASEVTADLADFVESFAR